MRYLFFVFLFAGCQAPLHSQNGRAVDPPGGDVFRCAFDIKDKPDCQQP